MTDTARKLREIIGQETTPPLWIYVTKDHVSILERAAQEIEDADKHRRQGFVDGMACMIRCINGPVKEFRRIWDSYVNG